MLCVCMYPHLARVPSVSRSSYMLGLWTFQLIVVFMTANDSVALLMMKLFLRALTLRFYKNCCILRKKQCVNPY